MSIYSYTGNVCDDDDVSPSAKDHGQIPKKKPLLARIKHARLYVSKAERALEEIKVS